MKPKWHKKLTKSEIKHIKDTTQTGSRAAFFRNREWQKENNVECFECEIIERKLTE